MLGPSLTTCQLATWPEHVKKFELNLNSKNGRENQTNMKWEWNGIHNKNDTECGKCKSKFNPDVRPCGEVKKMSVN